MDEYGFERRESFDYRIYESYISRYIPILARRAKRWSDLRESDKHKKSNTLKRFVRKGIPSSERGAIWLSISGAHTMQQQSRSSYDSLRKDITNTSLIEMISIDVPRTFPDNIFFTKDDVLPEQLFNVLATFAHQNHEVGYCQGLNYIAGLLLLATKSEEHTFWLLKILVEQILPPYYIRSMSGLLTDFSVLDELVRKSEPQVYRHIKEIGMPWPVGTTKWFICLYAEVLPTETVLRIWDCMFYEGSKILFRVALALIRINKEEILNAKDLGELVGCFRNIGSHSRVVNCHQFISVSCITTISIY